MSSVPSIDVEGIPVSAAIVERIANCEGVDPLDLPPLYEAVDPDALDALTGASVGRDSALQVEFSYCGYDVTVTGESVVHIDEVTDSPRATA